MILQAYEKKKEEKKRNLTHLHLPEGDSRPDNEQPTVSTHKVLGAQVDKTLITDVNPVKSVRSPNHVCLTMILSFSQMQRLGDKENQ